MTTTFDRNAVLEALKAKYEPRILAWFNKVREAIIKLGATCDTVDDTSGDEYKYSLSISFEGRTPPDMVVDRDIGMDFEITEAAEYGADGETEEEAEENTERGVTFAFRGVYWGGRVFGVGITPNNFTDACWVDMTDERAVERRFKDIEDYDPRDIAAAIKAEWRQRVGRKKRK